MDEIFLQIKDNLDKGMALSRMRVAQSPEGCKLVCGSLPCLATASSQPAREWLRSFAKSEPHHAVEIEKIIK